MTTGVKLAVDDAIPPAAYPVTNGQFATGTTTYSVGVLLAYQNPAGPHWRMNDGGFVMPRTPPESDVTYTVAAGPSPAATRSRPTTSSRSTGRSPTP